MNNNAANPVTIEFTKMHGLGNHFMVINLVTQSLELTPDMVRAWGDEHTGVGFDQLLILKPPSKSDIDFDYVIYNTDGSQAQQCGNGARCMAKFIFDEGLSSKIQHKLYSLAGIIEITRLEDASVEVDMGVPELKPEQIPFNCRHTMATATGTANTFVLDGKTLGVNDAIEITLVSMGNPHGIIFVDNIANAQVEDLGARLSVHEIFPEGANIGFCQIVDDKFARLRVFERGVGETQACGSGACAAMVAARLHDKLSPRAKISLPGGKVRMNWQGTGSSVKMIGPAVTVYRASIPTG